jgi:ubiquitin-like modifier-activating enzyme ATG7
VINDVKLPFRKRPSELSLSRSPRTNVVSLHGKIKNFNTIEEFRSPELKKELFNDVVKQLIQSFSATEGSPISTFNPFLLVTFADLKKYVYHYWFAFPALIQKPAWELVTGDIDQGDEDNGGFVDWVGDVSLFPAYSRDIL